MKNIKETLEQKYDNPRSGFIIETPFLSYAAAKAFENNGIKLLRAGNITKFYAADGKAAGNLVTDLTLSDALTQHALYNKYDQKITIYAADNRMNDSVGESQIFENERNNSPKSYFKRALVDRILRHDLDRSYDAIVAEFKKTTFWDEHTSALKKDNDVRYVLDRTAESDSDYKKETKTFIVSYVFYRDDEENSTELSSIKDEFRIFFEDPDFDIKFKVFRRKPTLIFLSYHTANAYTTLENFFMDVYLDGIFTRPKIREIVKSGMYIDFEDDYDDSDFDMEDGTLLSLAEYEEYDKQYNKDRASVRKFNSNYTNIGKSEGSVDN